MIPVNYLDNVFINCPFDPGYNSMFEAIVFAIHDCGFIPRCAKEEDDAGNVRIHKIMNIINECRYGIHDISKADLDAVTKLSRFNMPLELGLYLGAHRYSGKKDHNRDKKTLIMDIDPYRYRDFISDLGGQDIAGHNQDTTIAISKVRDFLSTSSRRNSIPGGQYIADRYSDFLDNLDTYCDGMKWERQKLTFLNYSQCVTEWIRLNLE